MYGFNPTPGDVANAMSTLAGYGVAIVVAEFSGGNDEGGVDHVAYYDANGNEVDKSVVPSSNAHLANEWDADTRSFKEVGWKVTDWNVRPSVTRDATAEEILFAKVAQVIEYPVTSRWGSFAGEFYVQGTVTWDVATGKHRLSGQESVEHYEDFEYSDE
jgi:hypothetical protein